MSTSDDFFYGLDDDFRSMPLSTIESLSVILSDDSPMSDWRMVTDRLGYSSRQIEMFQQQARSEGRLPCSLMLSEWSKGYNRTVRVLKHVLTDMGRMDAVLQLDEERRRKFKPTVVLKPSRGNGNVSIPDVEVGGRRTVFEALLPILEDHASHDVTAFNITNYNKTWRTEIHELQGQQVNITWEQRYQQPLHLESSQRLSTKSWLVSDEVIIVLRSSTADDHSMAAQSDVPFSGVQSQVRETRCTSMTSDVLHNRDRMTTPSSVPSSDYSAGTATRSSELLQSMVSLHADNSVPPTLSSAEASDRESHDGRQVSPLVGDERTQQQQQQQQHAWRAPPQTIISELAGTPGYHCTVGNKTKQIKRAMRRSRQSGEYILRSFEDKGQLSAALSVTYIRPGRTQTIKHFHINVSSTTGRNGLAEPRYYLFKDGFAAPSLPLLLQHYAQHPLDEPDFVLTTPVPVADEEILRLPDDFETAVRW